MFRAICISACLCATALATGCAAFNSLSNEVSTYGNWPAQRQPGSYAFEQLPSQVERPQRQQQQLESAARAAIEAAGFRPVAVAGDAEYLMQLGARVSIDDPWYFNDPFMWRGGWRYGAGWGYHPRWGRSPWGFGIGYGFPYSPTFDREVAVLIRDRATGELLYEARAGNSGSSATIDHLLPAMFRAAMADFPATGPNPRNISVPISAD